MTMFWLVIANFSNLFVLVMSFVALASSDDHGMVWNAAGFIWVALTGVIGEGWMWMHFAGQEEVHRGGAGDRP